ncbi:hypothetical protein [Pseudomonas putida]|uniref:hypothetical protein n=1 Tax=Pseudomonas TaxID=286 RepID=UPI0021F8BC7C|nr:hypothetical protein [Pseudomonas putida]
MKVLSSEAAQEIVESAFAPFEYAVQFTKYKESLGFQAKDSDGTPLTTREGLGKTVYRDPQELTLDIELARDDLTKRGFSLEPWMPPA